MDRDTTSRRSRLSRALVRHVSWWLDEAYVANHYKMKGTEKFCMIGANVSQAIAFPLARRLDKEAMVDQMVIECWWG